MLMADKSTFTSDEWQTLLESVMATGLAVTAAEPSGLFGLLQESFASGKMLAKARMDGNSNALIKAVVDDLATSSGRSTSSSGLKQALGGKKPGEIKTACIEVLGKTEAILGAKAPGDAAAYKGWLRQIAETVANASTEGGFLGIGGVVVSENEKATLAEISNALKLAS
jgi:hypothetical protein